MVVRFQDKYSYTPINKNQAPSSQFFQNIDSKKYVVEEHDVLTSDGYILKIFRVNLKKEYKNKLNNKSFINQPILMNHGLICSSDSFFLSGESRASGFYFAKHGFDVWLFNQRGNKYSHSHINQDISTKDFYNFSIQESGQFDIPAVYEYIIRINNKKIWYLG